MRDLAWAAKIILEFAQIPVTNNYIKAFENYSANKQWILSVLRVASSASLGMVQPTYQQALDILQENGIPVNPWEPNIV